MKTVDLLPSILSGFGVDKTPQAASPGQESFGEVFAKQVHQVGKEIEDHNNGGKKEGVGILTQANDPAASTESLPSGSTQLKPEDNNMMPSEAPIGSPTESPRGSSPETAKSSPPSKPEIDSGEKGDIACCMAAAEIMPVLWMSGDPGSTDLTKRLPSPDMNTANPQIEGPSSSSGRTFPVLPDSPQIPAPDFSPSDPASPAPNEPVLTDNPDLLHAERTPMPGPEVFEASERASFHTVVNSMNRIEGVEGLSGAEKYDHDPASTEDEIPLELKGSSKNVIPAEAGIQMSLRSLDFGVRRSDEMESIRGCLEVASPSPGAKMEKETQVQGEFSDKAGKIDFFGNPSLPDQEKKDSFSSLRPEHWNSTEEMPIEVKKDSLNHGVKPQNSSTGINTPALDTVLEKAKPFDSQPLAAGEKGSSFSSSLGGEWGLAEKILFDQKRAAETAIHEDPLRSQIPDGVLVIQGTEKVSGLVHSSDRPEGLPSSESPRFNMANIKEGDFFQHISSGMIQSLSHRGEKIELVLRPPELGNLFIEVKREKENIKAILWTDNPQTKTVLEANQAHLCKILKEDGFTLQKLDILFDQDTRSFQERERTPESHEQRKERRLKEDEISVLPDTRSTDGFTGRSARPGKYGLDLFV